MSKLAIYVMIVCQTFSLATAHETKAQRRYLEEIEVQISERGPQRPLLNLLSEIESTSTFKFAYSKSEIRNRKVDIPGGLWNMRALLKEVSTQTKLSIQRVNESIALVEADQSEVFPSLREDVTEQATVSGTVTDENGEPLPGATIQEKGTTNGTTTNISGNFSLSVSDNAILIVSFVGYETQEVSLNGRSVIDVGLQFDVASLAEVVVVGYGVQKKENLTGSVVAVSGEELVKRQVGQTSMALQGIAPGVTVTQRSGQPGRDGGDIRIRGIGTLNNADPLVLVDNVEMDINTIDPNIIESISVLKDAASAAIYGARAANGVILITTKRAKEGVFSLSYSGFTGIQEPTDLPEPVSPQEHMQFFNIAFENEGNDPLFDPQLAADYPSLHASDPINFPDVDWYDEVYSESGLTQSHFVTLNAGSERAKVIAGIGYFNQQGLIQNLDYERYTLRLNSDFKINDKLSAKVDMFLQHNEINEHQNRQDDPNLRDRLYFSVNRMPRMQPHVYPNGNYGIGWEGENPYAWATGDGYTRSSVPNLLMNLGINYEIVPGLNLNAVYSPQFELSERKRFTRSITTYFADGTPASTLPSQTQLRHDFTREFLDNLRSVLTYEKQFGIHNIKVLAGYQQETFVIRGTTAIRRGFLLPEFDFLNAGDAGQMEAEGEGRQRVIKSLFGRINYELNDRYLLEANFRRDQSSRFAEGNRAGFFPSVSAGWRLSEEVFWQPLSSTIDMFKLRASWGQLGNEDMRGQFYPTLATFNFFNLDYVVDGAIVAGAALQNAANRDLVWESTEMFNVGVDMTFFQRIDLSFDYYTRNTRDILLRLDIPGYIGLNAPFQNAGEVENKGWDLAINYRDKKGDLSYNIGFNLSDVRNQVLDLKGINFTTLLVNREGESMNSLLALESDGYFQSQDEVEAHAEQFGTVAPGDIRYVDQNDDGVINDDDRVIIGNTIPRFTYGMNINADWKGFDLAVLVQGVGLADGYLGSAATNPFELTPKSIHRDYWTPDNRNAAFPRLTFQENNNRQRSDFFLKSAAYLRLKNLQIGYSLPDKWAEAIRLQRARLYVSGQNLFTIDNFWDGFDVEAPVGDGSFYPQVKVYTIGIDFTL